VGGVNLRHVWLLNSCFPRRSSVVSRNHTMPTSESNKGSPESAARRDIWSSAQAFDYICFLCANFPQNSTPCIMHAYNIGREVIVAYHARRKTASEISAYFGIEKLQSLRARSCSLRMGKTTVRTNDISLGTPPWPRTREYKEITDIIVAKPNLLRQGTSTGRTYRT
jgi:hypothetical protein